METESGFITSGGFSPSIIEAILAIRKWVLQQNLYFSTDWSLRNEVPLSILKNSILYPLSIISKFSEFDESIFCQNIKFFLSLPFKEGQSLPFSNSIPEWCNLYLSRRNHERFLRIWFCFWSWRSICASALFCHNQSMSPPIWY